jgi:hypothetical protein
MYRFRASRGGHAPGHLRDAFAAYIDSGCEAEVFQEPETIWFYDKKLQRQWDRWPLEQRLRWLLGQLHNCSDVMPSGMCESLDLRYGSTYARAARKLLAEEFPPSVQAEARTER